MSEEKLLELSMEDIQEAALFDIRVRVRCFLEDDIKQYYKWFREIKPGILYRSGEYLMYESRKNDLEARVRFAHSIGLLSDEKYDDIFDMLSLNDKRVIDILCGGAADAKE